MMGYLNREDKTTEDIDEEGWFHSGDLGVQDEEGFVKITGEMREVDFAKTRKLKDITFFCQSFFFTFSREKV
jgi:long-subunit acyl-CoA synthetase (AMP-forming)